MNSELNFLDDLLLGIHLGPGEAVNPLLEGILTRTCVPLDLVLPLLVLPLPQQRGLQSEEVLLPHDAVVEEVQLELTAVGFS